MRDSFTLLEIIIVITIIAILAVIATPTFFKAVERARATEGVRVLSAIRNAQIRYYVEHGYLTNNLSDLDVDIEWRRFFDSPVPVKSNYTGGDEVVAKITRNATKVNPGYGAYELSIQADGDIVCNATPPNKCPAGF